MTEQPRQGVLPDWEILDLRRMMALESLDTVKDVLCGRAAADVITEEQRVASWGRVCDHSSKRERSAHEGIR